jgi:hypothetical protein
MCSACSMHEINMQKFWLGSLNEADHTKYLCVGGKIILRRTTGKKSVRV